MWLISRHTYDLILGFVFKTGYDMQWETTQNEVDQPKTYKLEHEWSRAALGFHEIRYGVKY
jgi:hypothetical protein